MEISEVLRQVLELEDDGSDWNLSEEEDEDGGECDNTAETTTLDPLDAAQLEDALPVEQLELLLGGVGLEEDTSSGTQGTRPRESVYDTTVTAACPSESQPSDNNERITTHTMSTCSDSSLTNHDCNATADTATNILSDSGFLQHIGPTVSLPASATPVDYFMLFFDNDLLQHIVDQTNLYAQKNPLSARYAWYDTTTSELLAFLGLIIMMGIKRLPSYTDYWSSNPLLGTRELVAGFPLNRFRHLLTRIHFNDNDNAPQRGSTGYDKLYKLRPILTAIHEKCLTLYDPHQANSVDEAMVGFKGRSTLKQ